MSIRKRRWKTAKGEEKVAWVVDYTYTDRTGERRRALKTFAKKKEADEFEETTKAAIRRGEHVAESDTVTVKEAGAQWIASGETAELERTTLDQYRQHLHLHIVPFIGAEKLSKLTVPSVRAFQDRLRETPYPNDHKPARLRGKLRSPAMVRRVTVSLGSILADAQERGLVARNVVREMSSRRKRGKAAQGERRQKRKLHIGVDIPTREEIRAIIEAADDRWRPLLVTAIFTGLRASELRGLRWCDVDLEAGRLHVRQRADRYHVIGMPKSDAGQRTVPLPPVVVNTLKEWRLRCPRRKRPDAPRDDPGELHLVFPNGAGNVEWHGNIINRGMIPTLEAAGVVVDTGEKDAEGAPIRRAKYTGMHALRHFYASWCINRRADGGLELPPKMVQERMGHSSITMTMDVYGHLFPSGDDAEALASAERDLLTAT